MRPLLSLAVLIAVAATVFAEEKPTKMLIAEAVLPLPEPLRARATVVSYDASGVRSILRQGTNDLICDADGPSEGYFVMCYHDSLAPHFQQRKKWAADGKGGAEIDRLLLEAFGRRKPPNPPSGCGELRTTRPRHLWGDLSIRNASPGGHSGVYRTIHGLGPFPPLADARGHSLGSRHDCWEVTPCCWRRNENKEPTDESS